jgi:hypothetical protein
MTVGYSNRCLSVSPTPLAKSAQAESDAVDDIFARIWSNLTGRIGGPLTLRLFIQPLVATVLAISAGVADGRAGRPPYFWAIVTHPEHRRDLLREGWKAVAKVFVLAVALDCVYQLVVFQWIYPFEALLVAFLLACLPYLLLRGPAARLSRRAARP